MVEHPATVPWGASEEKTPYFRRFLSASSFLAGVAAFLAAAWLQPAAFAAALRPSQAGAILSVDPRLVTGAEFFRLMLAVLGLMLVAAPAVLRRLRCEAPPANNSALSSRVTEAAPVATLLAVALLLRLVALDGGIWFDEVLTKVIYLRLPFLEAITTYDPATKNQHFLYTATAHLSVFLLGDTTPALRFPAVLFGVGSIWAAYLLGREVAGRREALLTAVLLTVSYHHVWFSQNARGYTALMFCTLVSSWCLVRGIRDPRPSVWILFAGSVALGMYAHLTMLFVVVGQFITAALLFAFRFKSRVPIPLAWPVLGFGLAGFLSLLLYSLVLPQLAGAELKDPNTVPAWTNPIASVMELLVGKPPWTFAVVIVAAIGGVVVLGSGLASFLRTVPIIVPLVLLPILITVAAAMATGQYLLPRHVFHTAGLVVLVGVRGMLVLGERAACHAGIRQRWSHWACMLPVLMLVLASALTVPAAYGPKQDFAGAHAFIQEARGSGDAVVMAGLAALPFREIHNVDWFYAEDVHQLDAIRSRHERTWAVYTLPIEMQALHADIMASLQREFMVVRKFDGSLGGGAIYVMLSLPSPAQQESAVPSR